MKNTKPIIVKIIYIFYLFLGLQFSINGQVITKNDGFEGSSRTGIPPPNWSNNDDGNSTVDTQPNIFDNTIKPSQGNSYISMVTRRTYSPGTIETVWADLLFPFEKGKCYNLKIDLSLTDELYGTYNGGNVYFNERPCVIQIIGFNFDLDDPEFFEILWESDELYESKWETFNIDISPSNFTYNRIAIRPNFVDEENYKNTAVLIDNMRYAKREDIFTIEKNILNISTSGTEIEWFFNGEIIPNENSNQIKLLEYGMYEVKYFDEKNCLIMGSKIFENKDENILCYPIPTKDILNVEHFFEENSIVDLSIYNDLGQLIKIDKREVLSGINKIDLNLIDLSAGVYFLKLEEKK